MQKLVSKLVEIGLTENEAKVYTCLLQKSNFTATELARCTQVNRSRIYTVLQCLIEKGFCIEKLGRVKKYQAIKPEDAFSKLKEDQEQLIHKIDSLPKLLHPIYKKQQGNSSPLDFIEVYGTPSSIIKKHHTLELESKKFVLSFCKKPYAMTNELNIHKEQKASMKTGVIYKSIFEIETKDIVFFARRMKNFEDQGEEIKVAYHLPIKLHVFDDQIVMFSMTNKFNPTEKLTYLVIEHSDLAEALITTFYKYWSEAISVTEFIKKEKIKL